ncbi:Low-density lipoprotein receptor domain class A [Chitinophaga eiseniae]|uniref:Low-density lipoprotein receptor domain class A n=1 Tax=Chitinophaga eiseniae TaxID=634771 RepID=A0A1T4SYW6_9BACT|nr:low-density lipoprotein receptor class A repeat-containing protein [Chitinophaga eiseniae]SKA33322.1 Low-density lipoprotein receptor domain class A [Chitinophaga eiseniae]
MKKISLKNLDTLGIQKLSRESLKNVQGGRGCPDDEFQCGDGSCIPLSYVNDGVADCRDSSDERKACTCTFKLTNGSTYNFNTPFGWNTDQACSDGCKTACANASGCASWTAVFASSN